MRLADKIIDQCRKPSGFFGRFSLWDMNRHHSKLTDWGLRHVSIRKTDRILDIGCGGGRIIDKPASMTNAGKVHGIEEAGDAAEGMEMVRELRPDAVIVDVGLPGGEDGIALTEKLVVEFPAIVVLILSAHDEPEYAQRAAAAGAMGYVLKNDVEDTLRMALRNAFKGKRTFRDEIGNF